MTDVGMQRQLPFFRNAKCTENVTRRLAREG